MSERNQKLVALRSRTDHDLVVLVQRELERCANLLHAATTRQSVLLAQAEKALSTATTLLPRICGVSQGDRLRIDAKAAELRSRLAQIPQYAKVQPYPAAVAS